VRRRQRIPAIYLVEWHDTGKQTHLHGWTLCVGRKGVADQRAILLRDAYFIDVQITVRRLVPADGTKKRARGAGGNS
jgi:hypothetical protein